MSFARSTQPPQPMLSQYHVCRPAVSSPEAAALPSESPSDSDDDECRMAALDEQPNASTSYEPDSGPIPHIRRRHTAPKSAAQERQAIREVKKRLQMHQQGLDIDNTPDAVWLESLQDILLPVEQYVAGFTQLHGAAWSEWLHDSTPQASRVMQAITKGLQFQFVPPMAASQQQRPHSQSRYQQVSNMLRRLVPPAQAADLLGRATQGSVHFPNKASLEQHADFVRAEACSLRQAGALRTPQELGMAEPPCLVHGLAVHQNRKGKLRLIVDARYLNLFLQYVSFKYETLQQAVSLLQHRHFLYTTDFKSGYHQVPLHLGCYPYMGVQIEGTVYVLPFLAFGIAPACRQFTEIMYEVYSPLQQAGQTLSSYIDDAMGAAQPKGRAKFHVQTLCSWQAVLGFYNSIPKCQLLPQ